MHDISKMKIVFRVCMALFFRYAFLYCCKVSFPARVFFSATRNMLSFQDIGISFFQNPREASSRSRIFLFLLVCMCVYVFIYFCIYLCVSRLLAKRKTILTQNLAQTLSQTTSKIAYFVFFEKVTLKAASLEKVQCHGDFPEISSIALFRNFFLDLYRRLPNSIIFKIRPFDF